MVRIGILFCKQHNESIKKDVFPISTNFCENVLESQTKRVHYLICYKNIWRQLNLVLNSPYLFF